MVVDANTGAVLMNEDGDSPRHPASLTKMMTLYLTFEAIESGRLRMTDRLTVSEAAASVAPSKLDLDPGETLTVEHAIKALITKSANDVAVALAERIGGDESNFVRLMNSRARELKMMNTTFRNASGLPNPAQITTARDMITLALALQDNFPSFYPLFATRTFAFRGRTYRNHNTMLNSFSGIDGIKTGYTRASGFNLVSSVRRGGRHVIGAVFGGASAATRNGEMRIVLTRSLTRASTVKSRKPAPLLIAKLKSAPKIAKRPEPKPTRNDVAAARPAPEPVNAAQPRPFAPPSETPQDRPTFDIAAAPAAEPADTADLPAYGAGAAGALTPPPIEVFKVKRVMVEPRSAQPVPRPDETTDMAARDEIALAIAADEAANRQANLERDRLAASEPQQPAALDGQMALLGAADREHEAAVQPAFVAAAAPAPAAVGRERGLPPSTFAAQAALLGTSPSARMDAARTAGQQPSPRASGGYEIQIGAYASVDEAKRSLTAVQGRVGRLLQGAGQATQQVARDGRQFVRARFTGFSAETAASACTEMRRQAVDCFVLAAK